MVAIISGVLGIVSVPFIFIGLYIIMIIQVRETKKIYSEVIKNDRVYCYGLFKDTLFLVANLDDIKDSSNYFDYYDKILNGTQGEQKFESSSWSYGGPSYYKESKLSKHLVEVYSIDTSCWGYNKRVIDKRLIHRDPIPDYFQQRLDSIRKLHPYKKYKRAFNNSPYGVQCTGDGLPSFLKFFTEI